MVEGSGVRFLHPRWRLGRPSAPGNHAGPPLVSSGRDADVAALTATATGHPVQRVPVTAAPADQAVARVFHGRDRRPEARPSALALSDATDAQEQGVQVVDVKLEVVVVAVSDVDRAKNFYKTLGWRLDADYVGSEEFRVVQLTPPGSE